MSGTIALPEGQAAVHEYVERVRAALADLPPEDLDELTGGLEADLREQAGELPPGTDLAAAFGAPTAYAAELRAAAGLPGPTGPGTLPKVSMGRAFEAWLREAGQRGLRRWPWLADLRPVWWLARGFVLAYVLVGTATGGRAGGILIGLAGAVASFAWSRGRTLLVSTWPNRFALAANTFAAIAIVPVLALLSAPTVEYVDMGSQVMPDVSGPGNSGTWVNGEAATNLYAYDAQGNRIDNVRLFNQYGQAVTVMGEAWWNAPAESQPPTDDAGAFAFNGAVFPIRWADRTGWEASSGGWEPPVQISELAAHQDVAPSATTSASSSPGPILSPTATPSASPSVAVPTATP
ncbi:MAG: hypothetical protein KBB39_05665 [Phycicoccus sp.]|mgnify:CR=1 FL=1|nr:hypothetical protein [Phycicoccus sp.]